MDVERKDPRTEMIEDCNNCHWMVAISQGAAKGLFCRRYPPKIIVLRTQANLKLLGINDEEVPITLLPQILPGGMSCGEFKRAPKLQGKMSRPVDYKDAKLQSSSDRLKEVPKE